MYIFENDEIPLHDQVSEWKARVKEMLSQVVDSKQKY